jgi:CBS domain-containing protein
LNDITVLQAKRFGIICCQSQDLLGEAARTMVEEDISGLVVTDEQGFLEGVITRADLLRAYRTEEQWAAQPVEKFMSRDVVTVHPQDRLDTVARLLLDRQIHRVVIVQKEGDHLRPIGVISDSDLVYHMNRTM